MIEIIETESEIPKCAHCEKEIKQLYAKKVKSTFGVRFIYFCRNCKKTLGLTQRKGFWMG